MKTPREDNIDALSHCSPEALDKLYDDSMARNDSYNAGIAREALARHGQVQTNELSKCGRLFEHRKVDPYTGRVTYEYTGDPRAFLAPFAEGAGPIIARMDARNFTGRNSPQARAYAATQQTVTVGPGERVQVVKA